jgi:ATP-binding cassette subfamily E protein 1
MSQKITRHAIVDYDKCRPTKCGKECSVKCPPNQSGKRCIVIEDIEDIGKRAIIYAELCIGCGLCIKACPFKAIQIVNIPHELGIDRMLYSYGLNSFRIYNYPSIKKGSCLGILGGNGLGKSTVIKILSGELELDSKKLRKMAGGSEFNNYVALMKDKKITVSYKPQDLSQYTRGKRGEILVSELLKKITQPYIEKMELDKLANRKVCQLSGGETQRLLISLACSKDADSYMFDEPSAFLDILQRIRMADMIGTKVEQSYCVLIEHDLCCFDYISDFVVAVYGEKGAYGCFSSPYSSFNGINNYLEGYLPTENVKIRDKPIKFKSVSSEDELTKRVSFKYGSTSKKFNGFKLDVMSGSFSTSQVIGLLGENGTGKSTLIGMFAGLIEMDSGELWDFPQMTVSIKQQDIYKLLEGVDNEMTVMDYLYKQIGNQMIDYQFKTTVLNPLGIQQIGDLLIGNLSGGQIQRVGLVSCLGKSASIYLLDEPSAYIDVEDRIMMASVIRKFTYLSGSTVFLVEHDLIFLTSISDQVIVFDGTPGICCNASIPLDIGEGINIFLKKLGVTMRKDKSSGRPRINKLNSIKDTEQKKTGKYFIIE